MIKICSKTTSAFIDKNYLFLFVFVYIKVFNLQTKQHLCRFVILLVLKARFS